MKYRGFILRSFGVPFHSNRSAKYPYYSAIIPSQPKKKMDEMEVPISREERAVSASPTITPNQASRSNNLGTRLSDLYEREPNLNHLQATISKAELVVSATPENHPDRAK